MQKEVELPDSHEDLKALRVQVVEKIKDIDLSLAIIRDSLPEEGSWPWPEKRKFNKLLREKKLLERCLPRINDRLKALNRLATETGHPQSQLTDEQREARRLRAEQLSEARRRLVSAEAIPNPRYFLHRASMLLSRLAREADQNKLTDDERLLAKTFAEIMTQPREI